MAECSCQIVRCCLRIKPQPSPSKNQFDGLGCVSVSKKSFRHAGERYVLDRGLGGTAYPTCSSISWWIRPLEASRPLGRSSGRGVPSGAVTAPPASATISQPAA